ncbi:aspartate--tRNA ligase [Pseudobacteriovorax antillogorgiicola]|uniref:Aspartate--tRNA ligase n=1 Tax=Pseudobacteriovorax antillogorgiicola TaxID=1513793 RepID=A0A1Y6BWH1_9BACT|nr:aspartate--tRNA ligase [Pseudobacteriovorax antillogorgiicola]TCS52418.1 aspartyl-tRNA synthetase [Pseudobacteriovorax antillogorgiicola]SMF28807.1 aspartyl-tRNA synthetase [Pseudobacteriovorax antillogorgiicola]
MLRTHTAGQLTEQDVNKTVTLAGWVDRVRDLGQLFFLNLRDRYGLTQCVYESSDSNDSTMSSLKSLANEYCVQVTGAVRKRNAKDINSELSTGAVEIVIETVKVLNTSEVLPVQVRDDINVSDDLRLKYRYLDLRRSRMQKNMQTRHKTLQAARDALCEMGFLEIETPLLIRSTPEGARDFVVPSRLHPGKFYALPQSPQLYKQMLMISGMDRYFQFAPAFRDEDLRADRVPVHTQIDMEMSFVDQEDVHHAVETMMKRIFKDVKGVELEDKFLAMPYAEAMERFGNDKPDMRFAMELKTITEQAKQTDFKVFAEAESVRCIVIEEGSQVSRKDIDTTLLDKAKIYGAKGLAWTRVKDGELSGGVGKFLAPLKDTLMSLDDVKEGTLILFVADSYKVACAALSAVRLELGKKLDLIDHSEYKFLWVNDFPLFEQDDESGKWIAMHHLFTHPKDEDMQYLDSDPSKVRGKLYDLVLNGVELLSGSIRINTPELQQKVLDIVEMPREESEGKFGFLMNAFKYGAPPHGGSAVGFDRLVALLCGEDSIREVIAYPCNNQGIFPLDGSPAEASPDQLEELQIKFKKPD